MANMLYNGVEFPDINTVWTDKETYPYAFIVLQDMSAISAGIGMYNVYFTTTEYGYNGTRFYPIENGSYINYQVPANQATVDYINANGGSASQDSWLALRSGSLVANQSIQFDMKWSNFDIDGFIEASDPVPVGGSSHITISSGDGYALYEGVKLPELPEYDQNTLSVCTISRDVGSFYGGDYCLFLGEYATAYYEASVNDTICAGIGPTLYVYKGGMWEQYPNDNLGTFLINCPDDGSGEVPVMELVWTKADILNEDGTIYTAASSPIPLDGMTVIEWDGVTDGLESSSNGFYFKVSDTVLIKDDLQSFALAAIVDDVLMGSYGGPEYVEEYNNCFTCPGFFVVVQEGGGSINSITFDSPGLYLATAQFSSGLHRTALLAYTPASTEPEEPEDTTKKDFWNGVACGLRGSGTPNFSDTSPFGVGYITGCKLRALREKPSGEPDVPDIPDTPTGVYDDTFPIEWNSFAIQNNQVKVDMGYGLYLTKISNLTLDATAMAGGVLAATIEGESLPMVMVGTQAFDVGTMAAFSDLTEECQVVIASVTSTAPRVDNGGLAMPETGLYFASNAAEDINYRFEMIEPAKVFFDSFPIDLNVAGAQIGAINGVETYPLVMENGGTSGAVWKISNMTPSLEELNSTYNTYFTVIELDGVREVSTPSTITASWDATGTFVKTSNNFWVVYEAQTIHTTPFDVNTPVTVDLTPGVYLSDGFIIGFMLSLLSLVAYSENDTYADDSMRMFLGTAEDAAKAMAEYET